MTNLVAYLVPNPNFPILRTIMARILIAKSLRANAEHFIRASNFLKTKKISMNHETEKLTLFSNQKMPVLELFNPQLVVISSLNKKDRREQEMVKAKQQK